MTYASTEKYPQSICKDTAVPLVTTSVTFGVSVFVDLLSLSFLALELDCSLSFCKAWAFTLILVLYQGLNANYFL